MPASSKAPQNGNNGGAIKDLLRDFMLDSLEGGPDEPNEIKDLLTEHFGTDPANLPITAAGFPEFLHINYQLAFEAYLDEPGRTGRFVGVTCPGGQPVMRRLLAPSSISWSVPILAPIDYVDRPVGVDRTIPCARFVLILAHDDEGPIAFWLWGHADMNLEVMATTPERALAGLDKLEKLGAQLSPYRGQCMTIEINERNQLEPRFMPRPPKTSVEDLILPPGVLEAIERHAVGVGDAREFLTGANRHLKRGLLLYGPPGTGKTHSIRYLISQMPECGVIILPGTNMRFITFIERLIELVEPGIVVIDDVDLITEDRSMPGMSSRTNLFNLLDILDGIHEDADMLFVFTTNRPEMLEPAFVARPGRIDQAVGVPLPDTDCRHRLFSLYTGKLNIQVADLDAVIERTEGVTASFIKEMVRRAAVLSAQEPGSTVPITVTDRHLELALDQLLEIDNPLTPLLLGGTPTHATIKVRATAVTG